MNKFHENLPFPSAIKLRLLFIACIARSRYSKQVKKMACHGKMPSRIARRSAVYDRLEDRLWHFPRDKGPRK